MVTGYVFHERLMWHDTDAGGDMMPPGRYVEPGRHLESPDSKRRLHNRVQVSGLYDHLLPVSPEPITVVDLLRVHTPGHIDHIRQLGEIGASFAGPQAPIGLGSYEIALLSVGSTYAAMAVVLTCRVENAYALARPSRRSGHRHGQLSVFQYRRVGTPPTGRRTFDQSGDRRLGRSSWQRH